MKKPGKWGKMGILSAVLFVMASVALVHAVNPWDTVNRTPGCSVVGCSACGGDDHRQCSPKQRQCTWRCDDGTHNGCLQDDGC
jgi:hypothetical protein